MQLGKDRFESCDERHRLKPGPGTLVGPKWDPGPEWDPGPKWDPGP